MLGAVGSWKTGRDSKKRIDLRWGCVGGVDLETRLGRENGKLGTEIGRRDPGLPMQGQERARLVGRPLTWPVGMDWHMADGVRRCPGPHHPPVCRLSIE